MGRGRKVRFVGRREYIDTNYTKIIKSLHRISRFRLFFDAKLVDLLPAKDFFPWRTKVRTIIQSSEANNYGVVELK